jgi:hypothetical protein
LSAERIAALSAADVRFPEYAVKAVNELGPTADIREYRWNSALQALRNYKEQHGNSNPPDRYKTPPPDSIALGKWLRRQREAFQAGTLSSERIAALSDAGVHLDAHGERR